MRREINHMTQITVNTILGNQVAYFAVYIIAVILGCFWFGYVLRRWSWIPRRRHSRQYYEKF